MYVPLHIFLFNYLHCVYCILHISSTHFCPPYQSHLVHFVTLAFDSSHSLFSNFSAYMCQGHSGPSLINTSNERLYMVRLSLIPGN